MIDIHTHILPGIDDGARNVDEALALISMLKNQGITSAVLTPHYYSHEEVLSNFLKRRQTAYQSIVNIDFNMVLASETYLSEALFAYDGIDELCIGNTRYLLLELPDTDKWSINVFRQIHRLIAKYNIKPIIAHAERYDAVRRYKKKIFRELVDLGCLLQFNIDSVINRKTRLATIRLMREGWADFVGSDCHNLSDRQPQFNTFNKIVKNKLCSTYLEKWDTFSL